ncbi:TPA: hypothetical protein ACXHW4_004819, partial [Enterobacter hormaechei]
ENPHLSAMPLLSGLRTAVVHGSSPNIRANARVSFDFYHDVHLTWTPCLKNKQQAHASSLICWSFLTKF